MATFGCNDKVPNWSRNKDGRAEIGRKGGAEREEGSKEAGERERRSAGGVGAWNIKRARDSNRTAAIDPLRMVHE